ncbi:MAG: hypothetical protein JO208_09950 [Alphaproteobacteria bacterium]|nr:hypothetical protein [Alphaproteobacteria bacterium]
MKMLCLASATMLALTATAYAAGTGAMSSMRAGSAAQHGVHVPPPGLSTLYDQNVGDSIYGWYSQTLSANPEEDEYIADDFVVPAGHRWAIKEVDVSGYYAGGNGPASYVNLLFWTDDAGLPSKKKGPAIKCDNLTPQGLDTGAFQIKLPKSCKVALAGSGKSGTVYWLTVQANMESLATSGYWSWEGNNNVAGNQGASWYYGGGLPVQDPKCLKRFETIQDCNGRVEADVAFALFGKDSGG